MTFDPTKPVTYDGRAARIICTDAKGPYPIVALVEGVDGNHESPVYAQADGHPTFGPPLINVPKTHEVWVNFYPSGTGYAYLSKDEADRQASRDCNGRQRYTVTEGQFDD